ncbi:Gfo/Idh/MocA family oxidoreductase [Enterobacteriaceae bacterium H18W14]|uniref:Gfo/Idh/MocA family protein n=1 Tax=Dryocola boscaweniae TaxID=2925397 RepID=UPI0022EFF9A4|nr:Gfo/Idh/MocA family oxidoreductase [Dryocola boscaweniae]MCT4717078.1 Gfo/Idh/MocA family oxidoreductase [Dryocola boscaweniae]
MMKRIRLGMVGGGEGSFIGGVHRIAARLDDQFELVAGAFSSSPEVAKRSGDSLFVAPERSYASWQEMAEQEAARPDGIEAVAIVTPNFLHVPIAKAFLEKKIHVICDKPLGISLAEGEELAALLNASGRHFILTHNYSALPMVREARARIANSEIGDIRNVEVEYLQGWLNDRLELTDNKQASWRGKAQFAGAGAIGDIGTHAWQLAAFVTGMEPESIRGELLTRIEGRELDDEVYAEMRYANGARGRLWASQVAPGYENDLRLRIVGSRGSICFRQQQPEMLEIHPLHGNSYVVTRNGVNNHDSVRHQCRTPAGHPEGYLEGFAQIYREAAVKIRGGNAPLLPGIVEGLSGMRFIETLRASSDRGGEWMAW